MGSMFMSTFMMFVPRKVQFTFLLILCLGLSYLESKSQGKVWLPLRWLKKIRGAVSPGKKSDRPISRRLEQLESLKTAGIISEKEYKERRKKMKKEL